MCSVGITICQYWGFPKVECDGPGQRELRLYEVAEVVGAKIYIGGVRWNDRRHERKKVKALNKMLVAMVKMLAMTRRRV